MADEWVEELKAQIEAAPEAPIQFELQTDSGSGTIEITDVIFEDSIIKVSFA